jgi:hypothetical protein
MDWEMSKEAAGACFKMSVIRFFKLERVFSAH